MADLPLYDAGRIPSSARLRACVEDCEDGQRIRKTQLEQGRPRRCSPGATSQTLAVARDIAGVRTRPLPGVYPRRAEHYNIVDLQSRLVMQYTTRSTNTIGFQAFQRLSARLLYLLRPTVRTRDEVLDPSLPILSTARTLPCRARRTSPSSMVRHRI